MRQLTALDQQFLALEDSRHYGDVGGLAIFDPSTAPGGELTLIDLQNLITERLPLVPPFHWRLIEVPFDLDYGYWMEDPDFDLEFHVRELALAPPGTDAQPADQVARIFSRPLDRSRPLSELYLIYGLPRGRVAVMTKIHHAVIDGMSGGEIIGALLDLTPDGREPPPPLEPSNAGKPGRVSAHRRFAFTQLSLQDVKDIKTAHGFTVNDVIVSICAGAVRRWLIRHDELPGVPLVAQIPVSVRTEEQRGTFGNRILLMTAPLYTSIEDPVDRLRATHEALVDMKQRHSALPADLLRDANQFVPPALFSRAAQLTFSLSASKRGRPAWNLVVSNVPGPQIPLYMAGARLEAQYPISVITDGMGLNITVMSYCGQLNFGIVADREQMPDIWSFERLAARSALDELRPEPTPAEAPATTEPAAGSASGISGPRISASLRPVEEVAAAGVDLSGADRKRRGKLERVRERDQRIGAAVPEADPAAPAGGRQPRFDPPHVPLQGSVRDELLAMGAEIASETRRWLGAGTAAARSKLRLP